MAPQAARKLPDASPTIPDRLYFRIGDVARLCGVEPYVLRFWETQFPQLKPNKSGTGQRLYRRRDVEMALEIKHLVHDAGYTIQGARQYLEQPRKRQKVVARPAVEAAPAAPVVVERKVNPEAVATLDAVRQELRDLVGLLTTPIIVPEPVQVVQTISRPVKRRARASSAATAAASMSLLFPS